VSITANAYGFVVNAGVLVLLCLVTGVSLGPEIVMLVPAVGLVAVLASAFALVLAALHVYFRDVRFLVTAALTVWLYVTPIIFQVDQLPHALRPFVRVNPMTGVVELFRDATVGASSGWTLSLVVTAAWIVALVLLALVLHRRFDRLFADRLLWPRRSSPSPTPASATRSSKTRPCSSPPRCACARARHGPSCGRCATSTSRSPAASAWASSVATVQASRRCCRCSRG
jgi:hypothetical protein